MNFLTGRVYKCGMKPNNGAQFSVLLQQAATDYGYIVKMENGIILLFWPKVLIMPQPEHFRHISIPCFLRFIEKELMYLAIIYCKWCTAPT